MTTRLRTEASMSKIDIPEPEVITFEDVDGVECEIHVGKQAVADALDTTIAEALIDEQMPEDTFAMIRLSYDGEDDYGSAIAVYVSEKDAERIYDAFGKRLFPKR